MTARRRDAHRRALRERDRIYARIPNIECKGLCHTTCTAIDASQLERDRLAARGFPLPNEGAPELLRRIQATGEVSACPALGPDKRCRGYEDRPVICRVWGVTDDLPCPHGCVPDGDRYLTGNDVRRLTTRMERVSRAETGVTRLPLIEDPP